MDENYVINSIVSAIQERDDLRSKITKNRSHLNVRYVGFIDDLFLHDTYRSSDNFVKNIHHLKRNWLEDQFQLSAVTHRFLVNSVASSSLTALSYVENSFNFTDEALADRGILLPQERKDNIVTAYGVKDSPSFRADPSTKQLYASFQKLNAIPEYLSLFMNR